MAMSHWLLFGLHSTWGKIPQVHFTLRPMDRYVKGLQAMWAAGRGKGHGQRSVSEPNTWKTVQAGFVLTHSAGQSRDRPLSSLCGDRWAGGYFLHCRPGSSECDSHSKLLWHSSLNRHRWEDQTTCPFLRVLGQMCSCNVPSRSKDTFLTLWWHLPLVDGHWGVPGGWVGKESACQCRRCMGLIPGSGRCPGEPIPVFLPGKSHGQRSLADYRSWGHKRVGHDRATKQQQIGHCPGRGTCLGSYSGSQWGTPGLWL